MNLNLVPVDQLLAAVRDASGLYLLPMIIALALLALGLAALVRSPAPPADTQPAPAAAPNAPVPTILVVDDSAVVRAKLKRLFEGAGLAVELANDGVQALHALSRRPFAVLLTDLEMPNMGGIELIASVQGSLDTEDLPIIAITGHDALDAHVRDVQGLYGIFRKPWNDRELLRRVQALATLRRAAPHAAAGLTRAA